MDSVDKQRQLLSKFQKRIRQVGEPESLYQHYDKVSHYPSKKEWQNETMRDSFRESKKESKEKVKTVVPRQVQLSNYKIYQVLLDSNDRNKTAYPILNHFVLKVATPFRNVFAIRILKSELLYHSLSLGNGIYLNLNDYKLLIRNEQQDSLALFGRITPGVCDYHCVTTNILDDPYTHILNPMEPKLQRFEMKLYDQDNLPKQDSHFNLILHVALFCYT